MEYLPYFLQHYNYDLQPTNSVCVDLESAKTVLYPGAHIATSNPYEHYHHGIVVDINTPDISIIHFWGAQKDTSRIQTTTLPIFLAGGIDYLGKNNRRLYLVNYPGDTLEKQQETVKVAKELLEKADDIVYDLVNLNCESFACFCRTGKWYSEQIKNIKELLVIHAPEIYEKVRNADEQNRKQIASILKTIPSNAIDPSSRALLDQLCQRYIDEASK
jgi:hypothetical protein